MSDINTRAANALAKKLFAKVKDIKSQVVALGENRMVVGIPPEAKYPNGKSVAKVAECITYGVHEDGRPMRAGPRRFMTVAIQENRGIWNRMLQQGLSKALKRQERPDLNPVLLEVGERMKNDIQKTMLDMEVYDTGCMHDSISVIKVNNEDLAL